MSSRFNISDIEASSVFEVLVSRIGRLRRFVQSKIPQRFRPTISADDVLQEVWIAAYRKFSTFEPTGPDALDRWLTTIAHAKLIDALRAARRLKRAGNHRRLEAAKGRLSSFSDLFTRLQSPQATPSSELHMTETGHALMIALNGLSEARRKAIQLRFIGGLSHKEIATEMGKSEAAINSLLARGCRELREVLGSASKYFSDAISSE